MFRLVQCVLFLSSLWCVPAQPLCQEEEYPVGAECCPRCSPGYHVKQVCSELTGTVCEPCSPQTYTAHANGLSQCLPCGVCDPDMGMVTWRECSGREDTICRCIQGYFCQTQDGDHCAMCLPHSTCSPGQRVQTRGNDSQDTMCADCLTGTFSPGGTQETCLPWTKCLAWLKEEREHGTSSTDASCSFSWGFYLLVVIVSVLVLVTVAVLMFSRRRRHTRPVTKVLVSLQGKRQENPVRFPVTEVTIVAEEETALNC
ncbi:tumor necrosis factor receptor superfamily member 14 [Nannospalax galili]|uniref:tumor necrosis factor receptor superfamily member 14 n=1 Tax=Nannospalax galili TaxID=1026970 RepID=UPI0004ECFDA2|nr:tumor necrosis factor receptor superfamily member 14 [Nannospalax galili]